MIKKRDRLLFSVLRPTERVLPVGALYWIVKIVSFVRAALRSAFKKAPAPVPLPDCFNPGGTVQPPRLERMAYYQEVALLALTSRFATRKWLDRCRINGLEHIQAARINGRPVVIAACHFGPFFLQRYWLRAAGVRVAALVGGTANIGSKERELHDPQSPFPELRLRFYEDELRGAIKFLAAGNVLLVAIDHERGEQIEVPVRNGWSFQMATGALRLAIRHQAELIPYCIIDEGRWRFRLEIGRPVPREFLADDADLTRAGKHLLDEMLVHFQKLPEQCPKSLLGRFHLHPEGIQ